MKMHVAVENGEKKILMFFCPGCRCAHPFHVPEWNWNGSLETPTFSPSLLVNGDGFHGRCHSFVSDGKIQFLGDCDHLLKNQTVDIPDWDEDKKIWEQGVTP